MIILGLTTVVKTSGPEGTMILKRKKIWMKFMKHIVICYLNPIIY